MPETFVDCNADIKAIDASVRNRFKWSWLEEKDLQGNFLSDYIRKIPEAGLCYCIICKRRLSYGGRGKAYLTRHAQSSYHKLVFDEMKGNQTLPAVFQTFSRLDGGAAVAQPGPSRPYGAAPNVPESLAAQSVQEIQLPKPPIMKNRISNQEAMVCSFIAEHSLPLSTAPHLIEFAQTLSQDRKALHSLSMERQTATYKMKYGLHELEKKRLVKKLQSCPFSMNLDESTTKHGKKRVLNVLVCFFDEALERSVTHLYMSKEMKVVNAETVFNTVTQSLLEDKIPFFNLMSILSDSAAYMRGCNSGFFKIMKDSYAPHLLDIDGDVCHHLHNISKLFSSSIDEGNHLTKLLDDLFYDFSSSPDLREEFFSLCKIFNVKGLVPKERAGHRWMSLFDCAERLDKMEQFLTVFYYSWLSKDDKDIYKDFIVSIFTEMKVSSADRQKIFSVLRKLKSKNLTQAGKARKLRICHKLFVDQDKTLFLKYIVLSIFPLFKNVILSLEQKVPTIHLLYHKQVEIFSTFLKYFVKPEFIRESGRRLSQLDLTRNDIFLPLDLIFVHEYKNIRFKR